MSDNNNHPLGEAPWFHVILSTGLGSGFVPVAPGTAGAFLALLIWYAIYLSTGPVALFWITLALIVATTIVGAWTSSVMEKYWGEDPRTVNIDEFVGTWIPLLVAYDPVMWRAGVYGALGFGFFRLIDITKPLGCKWVDRNIKGGWGVMLDDVLAGTYALVVLAILRFVF